MIAEKKNQEEEKKTKLVNTNTAKEEQKKTAGETKEDFGKSPKTVLITEEPRPGGKVSIGKRAVIFIGSAAITIAIGLLVLKAVKGNSPEENFGAQFEGHRPAGLNGNFTGPGKDSFDRKGS